MVSLSKRILTLFVLAALLPFLTGATIIIRGPRVASSVFAPSDIGTLIAWYDADDITGSDGDSITAWLDKTVNNHDMTSGYGTRVVKTGIVSGHRVARFNGSAGLAFGSFGASTASVFVVGAWKGSLPVTGYPGPVGSLDSGESPVGNYLYINNGTSDLTAGGTVEFYPANPQTVDGFFSAYYETGSGTTIDALRIGGNGNAAWNGDVAVVLVFSATLSSGDKASLFQWAENTYGVAYP